LATVPPFHASQEGQTNLPEWIPEDVAQLGVHAPVHKASGSVEGVIPRPMVRRPGGHRLDGSLNGGPCGVQLLLVGQPVRETLCHDHRLAAAFVAEQSPTATHTGAGPQAELAGVGAQTLFAGPFH
jgi:hypothetical protein